MSLRIKQIDFDGLGSWQIFLFVINGLLKNHNVLIYEDIHDMKNIHVRSILHGNALRVMRARRYFDMFMMYM